MVSDGEGVHAHCAIKIGGVAVGEASEGGGAGRVGDIDYLDAVVGQGGNYGVSVTAYLKQIPSSSTIQFGGTTVKNGGHRYDCVYQRPQHGNLDGLGGPGYPVASRVADGPLADGQGRGGADRLHLGGVEGGPDGADGGRLGGDPVQGHVAALPDDGQPGVVGGGVVEWLAEGDVQDAGIDVV